MLRFGKPQVVVGMMPGDTVLRDLLQFSVFRRRMNDERRQHLLQDVAVLLSGLPRWAQPQVRVNRLLTLKSRRTVSVSKKLLSVLCSLVKILAEQGERHASAP